MERSSNVARENLYFSGRRARRGFIAVCALVVSAGCGRYDPADRIAEMNNSNIRRVANLYNAFQLRKGMRGPKDKAEFTKFIQQEMSPVKLERMLVDKSNIESLFTSERDQQPFVIRYGVPGGLGSAEAVVFETDGEDGLREVAFTNGTVQEMESAAYEQHLQGKAAAVPTGPAAQSASGT
jgi:hypothetical protein